MKHLPTILLLAIACERSEPATPSTSDALPTTDPSDTPVIDTHTDTDTHPTDTDTGTPPFLPIIPMVTVGEYFACAIDADGDPFCWGRANQIDTGGDIVVDDCLSNYLPPLGRWSLIIASECAGVVVGPDGLTSQRWPLEAPWSTADDVTDHPRPLSWLGHQDGGNGVCGIDDLGTFVCANLRTPSMQPPGDGWLRGDIGWYTVCGIHSTRGLECFGDPNEWGTLVEDHPDAIDVSVGSGGVCVINADHTVDCAARFDTVPSRVPEDLDDAAKIATAGVFACALRATGEIACWGDATGYFGNGVVDDIPPDTDFVDVDVWFGAACASHADGRVSCWGTAHGAPLQPPEPPNPPRP